MIKYLLIAGAGLVVSKLSEYSDAKSKLNVQFNGIDSHKIDWFNARISLSLLISNGNNFSIEVSQLDGHLFYGQIKVPVTRQDHLVIGAKKNVRASFTLNLEYDELLISLSNVFQSGQRRNRFFFNGTITGRADGLPFSLPIQHEIPLMI
ncbi:MAG: hypothetical protein AAF985_17650 [Bacteroidota bacterium]